MTSLPLAFTAPAHAAPAPVLSAQPVTDRAKIALVRAGTLLALCDADAELRLSVLSLDPHWCRQDVRENVFVYGAAAQTRVQPGDLLLHHQGAAYTVLSERPSATPYDAAALFRPTMLKTRVLRAVLETRLRVEVQDPVVTGLRQQQAAALRGESRILEGRIETVEVVDAETQTAATAYDYVTRSGVLAALPHETPPEELSRFLLSVWPRERVTDMALSRSAQQELSRLSLSVRPLRAALTISVQVPAPCGPDAG